LAVSQLLRTFVPTNHTKPMAMHSDLKHNSLKISTLSPIDGGEKTDFAYSFQPYASRLSEYL